MQRWQLISGAVAVASLVAVVLVFFDSDHGDGTATAIDDAANGAPVLLAADSRGAAVGTPEGIAGVARDSTITAWKLPAGDFAPLHIVCAPTCPAAVASSDSLNLNSPLAPDPPPLLLGGALLPQAVSGQTGGKAAILAAGTGGALRLATDDEGDGAWTMTREDSSRSVAAPAGFVDWLPTSDNTAAVAAWQDGQHRMQQLWKLSRRGWEPVGDARPSADGYGCAARRGDRWVIDGLHIESKAGSRVPIRIAHGISNCAFTHDRLVTARYTLSQAVAETSLAVFSFDGTPVFERTFPAEFALSADVTSDRFVLVGDHEAHVFDRDGGIIDRIRDVASARFVEDGSLVVVDGDGRVTWR